MKKVFHFDTPRGDYRADAAVVCCFDRRFDLGFRKFLKRSAISTPDIIMIAGGAKSLSSPERESDGEFVLDQIRKSIRLHQTKRVILIVHSDCGAYGGLAAFKGNARAEAEHHAAELRSAAANVREAIPGIEVLAFIVDFEGVWELAPENTAAS